MDNTSPTTIHQIDNILHHHQASIDIINTTLSSQVFNLASQQSNVAEIKLTLRQLSQTLAEISSKLSSYQPPPQFVFATPLQTQPDSPIHPPPPTLLSSPLPKIQNPTNLNYDISSTSVPLKTSLSNNIETFNSVVTTPNKTIQPATASLFQPSQLESFSWPPPPHCSSASSTLLYAASSAIASPSFTFSTSPSTTAINTPTTLPSTPCSRSSTQLQKFSEFICENTPPLSHISKSDPQSISPISPPSPPHSQNENPMLINYSFNPTYFPYPLSYVEFDSAFNVVLMNPMTLPPQVDSSQSSATLFAMVPNEKDFTKNLRSEPNTSDSFKLLVFDFLNRDIISSLTLVKDHHTHITTLYFHDDNPNHAITVSNDTLFSTNICTSNQFGFHDELLFKSIETILLRIGSNFYWPQLAKAMDDLVGNFA